MVHHTAADGHINTLAELEALRQEWSKAGHKVVFTNGVFDLLHKGHVTYLAAAARLGDVLVVGINDDASVRRLGKGEDRPIVPEADRAAVVAALRSVDSGRLVWQRHATHHDPGPSSRCLGQRRRL